LWHILEPGRYLRLAEVAHIVAAGKRGPRADPEATDEDLTSESNLIILCPNTHTAVDAAPDVYTTTLLTAWKETHTARVNELFGVASYSTRNDARLAVEPMLAENRSIWQRYGPESDAAGHPNSEAYEIWVRLVAEKILPNNSRIRRTIDANVLLLNTEERATALDFNMHDDAFAARHLTGEFNPEAPRFPNDLNHIFQD
jgi:hypothetical protein